MDKRQINKKEMLDAVSAYLDANAATWTSINKVGEVKNQLEAIRTDIESAATTQAATEATFGQTKLALKKTIANKADIVNDMVEVWATLNGDDELARRMSDTEWKLFRMPYEAFVIRVALIIEKAQEHQEELIADYGMTAEQITNLQTDLDNLLEIMGKPRQFTIQRAVATQSLSELIELGLELLKSQLDNLMKIFKRRDPAFYDGYIRSRIVVDD